LTVINPLWAAALFGISEAIISSVLRSKSGANADKGSLLALWTTINLCMFGAITSYLRFPGASFGGSEVIYWIGCMTFVLGFAIRWYSIAYLGRFFTVDVAIAADQKVIDSGPYRIVRHPSYSGCLAIFLGLGLMLANFISLALLTVPTIAVFLYRIRVEEEALLLGLGAPYSEYMKRTSRLIPHIY
jgi:protein-S-isoprenylcysteine O-methyltransferase